MIRKTKLLLRQARPCKSPLELLWSARSRAINKLNTELNTKKTIGMETQLRSEGLAGGVHSFKQRELRLRIFLYELSSVLRLTKLI